MINTLVNDLPTLTVQLCRTALGSTHDKNLSREAHPTIRGIVTKGLEGLALRFTHLFPGKHADLFPKVLRHLESQSPIVFQRDRRLYVELKQALRCRPRAGLNKDFP